MMITSFRHDNERKGKRRKLLGALLLLTFLIFLVRGPLSNSLGGLFATIGRPFWAVEEEIKSEFAHVQNVLISKEELAKENAQLRADLDHVAIEAYSRERMQDENDQLKAKLGRDPEMNFILARVLTSPATSPYDTLIIDAGEEVGARAGMDVYADGDFIIGKLSRTWKRGSIVTLASSPENELNVTVGSSSIPALAHGVGGGNLRIVLPRASLVSVGDLVDIPALGAGYAGVVSAIDQPEGTSLEALFLKLPFNMSQVRWVYLAVPKDDKKAVTPHKEQ